MIITNGTIIDGTGKPRFSADIGIKDGVIKDVGLLGNQQAVKFIGASGQFVAPGFIDITNHSDANGSLFIEPLQEASLTQGVTTIVVGNCGVSLAPLVSSQAIKAIGKWQDISSANINWTGVREYLDELARHKLGVNVATLVGHSTLRRGLIGDEARALSQEELVKMQYLIEKSITEGAFGFSTSLSNSHEQVASIDEIISMVRVLNKTGGIYKTHLKSESHDLLSSVNDVIRIGRETRVPVAVSHMKAIGRRSWRFYAKAVKMIESASADKVDIHFDVFPYARTGSFLYQILPGWAKHGGFKDMFEHFRNPDSRARLIENLKPETLHFDKVIVASAENSSLNGKSVAEIAERAGQSAEEMMLDIILESQGKAMVFGNTLSARNVTAGIKSQYSAVASDGGGVSKEFMKKGKLSHPRSFGTFTHFLHKFVRDKNIISWEEGIRKITSLPADIMEIKSRGRIQPQHAADIVIFDPNLVADQATYKNPHLVSKGINAVIVNGAIALVGGRLTGVGAGMVLRKGK